MVDSQVTLTLISPPVAPRVLTMNTACRLTSRFVSPSPVAVTMLESTISSVYGEPKSITEIFYCTNLMHIEKQFGYLSWSLGDNDHGMRWTVTEHFYWRCVHFYPGL